jgi:hypothetical protein
MPGQRLRRTASQLSSLSAAYQSDRNNAARLCSLAQQQASHAATKAGAAFHATATALAGKSVSPARGGAAGVWESSEPFRKVLEFVLAPLDIVAADHWVSALEEVAGQPAEWVKQVDEGISEVKALAAAGKSPVEALVKSAYTAESAGSKIDAWEAFAPGWLRTAAGSIAGIKGLSYTLGGLGLVADAGTIVSPQDKGAMGNVDRGVELANGGLITADMIMTTFTGIGEVALAGTGIYLAGDFLYHHWTPFHNVANDVGHATVRVADDAGHDASSVISAVGSWFR